MRNRRSIGELISTLTFFGLALYLVPYSLAVIEEGDNLRGYFGLLAALFCACGALRFVIADLFSKWGSK